MGFLFLLIAIEILMLLVAYLYLGIPSVIYSHLYRGVYLKRYNQDYSPSLSIFIPCQGTGNHLAHNVRIFLENHYPQARLFFIVESRQDPAYAAIARLIEDRPEAFLVEAGPAGACGQKNHNLIQGIKAAERKDDVYVFFDSISTFTPDQLHDLLVPLSDPNVSVSTGFRWDILRAGTLGQRVHAFMIAVQWSLLNSLFIRGTWGGCTAIRRQTFEEMEVATYWARTVVDDTALVNLLHRQRRKVVLVPTCIKEIDSPAMTVKESILWFRRQVLYTKFYRRFDWSCALALLVWCSANFLAFPVLLACALIWPDAAVAPFAAVTGICALAEMICAICLKRPAQDNHSVFSWLLLSPVFIVCTTSAFVLGLFTTVLRWRHVIYHLDYDGIVKRVERSGESTYAGDIGPSEVLASTDSAEAV